MRRASLLSTSALALFVIGTPVLVTSRLLNGVLPLQGLDLLIAAFVLGWVHICMAIIKRDDALDALTQPRFSLQWQANNLVAQSLLGVGMPRRQPVIEDGLVDVRLPVESIDALLPPAAVDVARAAICSEQVETPRRIVPSLTDESDSDGPEILATEEYIVARGDTFWSIAEYAFGDGRHWQRIQQLNLGREVAPGVLLNDSHEPRIGWSILIPLVESVVETDAANVPS